MKKSLVVCMSLLVVTMLDAGAAELSRSDGFAENIYAEYAAASSNLVTFEVTTLETGALSDIATTPFRDLLWVPNHRIEGSHVGTEINDPQFTFPVEKSYALHDMKYTAETFEDIGLRLENGEYRKLTVFASIGTETIQHEAMEFCWSVENHCALLDPVVVFAQSIVETRERLLAEGWGRVEETDTFDPNSVLKTAECGLASNPNSTVTAYYWGSWSVDYKNIFGWTLIHKSIGKQKAGLRCNNDCVPDPYGYSYNSSCWATPPWTCACDNEFGFGTGGYQGRTGKFIAETKCTHKFLFQAKAEGTVEGKGSLAVDIDWEYDGGVDSNGGQIYDTCGYYGGSGPF